MSFLVPMMLWGALAAGIPIALHFLFRSHYRRIPWAAMKFLLESIEQTSRRMRFQELLLLLLRVALLALLALALARPLLSWVGGGGGEAVDAVFVFDVSASMDARSAGVRRLDAAKTAAAAVLDHLPLGSTVRVITAADQAQRLGPPLPANSPQLRRLIEGIEITHLATDFLPGMREAAVALAQGDAGNKELYLFSDMQQLGWDRQPAELATRLQEIHQRAAIYLVRCGGGSPKNAALIGVAPQAGLIRAGQRVPFTVLVRNTGREAIRNLAVTLSVGEGEKETQAVAELTPGETRSLTLMARFDAPGLRVVRAAIKQDDLAADNRFDCVVRVRPQVRLLVVDGAPNDRQPEKSASFYLLHALLPVREAERANYFVQPRLVSADLATPNLLADADACILVNAAVEPSSAADPSGALSSQFIDALTEFVRQGHGLLVFAGDRVTPGGYNRALVERHAVLPCRLLGAEAAGAEAASRLDPQSAADGPLGALAGNETYKALAGVEIRKRLGVEAGSLAAPSSAAAGRVWLRYGDGRPAIVAGRVGRGQVLLVTTSADVTWTDWPRWQGMYVPVVDMAMHRLLGEGVGEHNATAGEPLRFHPADEDAASMPVMVDPRGMSQRLPPVEWVEGRPVVTAKDTSLAGPYWLTWLDPKTGEPPAATSPARPAGVPFAVVPNPVETESLDPIPETELSARLGFAPVFVSAAGEMRGSSPRDSGGREWSLFVLLCVCGIALAESGLAWFCGRSW